MRKYSELHDFVVQKIGSVLASVDEPAFDLFTERIASARRVICFGLGREGLALRGFCMRLMHLGIDTHFAGDVTAKPVGEGDVVIVTSGPGKAGLTQTMIRLGQQEGAFVIVVTAQPESPDAQAADQALVIPAQTMANDQGSQSVLVMGTALEERYRDREVPIPDNWGGYRVAPETIEFWQVRKSRLHDRLRYRRNDSGAWIVERLAP